MCIMLYMKKNHFIFLGLAMDTSEENSMDSTALYPEVGQTSFYAAKDAMSPTSQIARFENRNSHTLQLMKASFFNTDTGKF